METAHLIVGTDDGVFVVGNAQPQSLRGQAINQVLGTSNDTWALSADGTVWLQVVGGDWRSAAQGGTDLANCLLVAEDRVLVGGAAASLAELDDGKLQPVASFDEVPGRSDWYTPWGGPPDVRSMARGVDGTLYVNVHVGGVVRSIDAGTTWADTLDIDSDVHQVVADPDRPGQAYLACARGFGVTTDSAETWTIHADGIDRPYCRAVAVSATSVFISGSAGPGGGRSALYRKPLDGGVFQRCTEGLPEWFSANLNTFCLDARGSQVVAGDADGIIYESHDDGDTWRIAAEGLPGVRCLTIA